MKFHPMCSMSQLLDCEPGDLVRTAYSTDQALALVGIETQSRSRLLVCLPHTPNETPFYEFIHHNEHVLNYGKDYSIFVDHRAEMELRPKRLFERIGSIQLVRDSLQLRVGGNPKLSLSWPQHYDFKSGTLIKPPDFNTPTAVFSAWSLGISTSEGKHESLYKFELTR